MHQAIKIASGYQMTDKPQNQFSASAAALGYLYQCRAAALLLLRRLRIDPTIGISIEKYDDISFETADGKPIELVQTKHRICHPGSLTNASSDLWKTIRIWIEQKKMNQIEVPGTLLTIITTSTSAPNSAAAYLRTRNRDVDRAREILLSTAKSSESIENRAAYASFLSLSMSERDELLDCMHVIDKAPDIIDVREQMMGELITAVRPQFLAPLHERFEGWWFQQCVAHLSGKDRGLIDGKYVLESIHDIAEGFQRDNLPIDEILGEPPEGIKPNDDQRTFVRQLRMIAASSRTIEWAIRDYYKAFEQRARWVREDLLLDTELERYEHRLVEEWDRYHSRVREQLHSASTEEEKIRAGKRVYEWSQDAELFIRPKCTAPFVVRGSLHMLANEKRVGWHPEFLERLRRVLAGEGST